MATASARLDELVKDYLLFRGLTSTLRNLEAELKNDKEKGMRVDKIIEQLQSYINNYDLCNLRDYWLYLNHRLFSRLEQRYMASVRKLEVSLLKLYVVSASQSNRLDKVTEFFERMTPELQNQPEFREWFAFPFLQTPQENVNYTTYFTKQWQDTLILSLHNFLSVILQAMPVPTLLNFEHDYRRMKLLQEENDLLKQQIIALSQKAEGDQRILREQEAHSPEIRQRQPSDLVYDFSGLSEDNTIEEKQQKSRRFPLNLSSPLVGRRNKLENNQPKQDLKAAKSKPKQSQVTAYATKQPVRRISQSSGGPGFAHPQISTGVGGPPVTMVTQEAGVNHRQRQSSVDYEKQRKELLGIDTKKQMEKSFKQESDPNVAVSKEILDVGPVPGSNTNTICRGEQITPDVPASPVKSIGSESEKSRAENSDTASTHSAEGISSIPEGECPFLLLSQDEYGEHHSALSYCKFSMSGQYVSSLDVDGVVKVWTWSPQPVTTATVMSRSSFLSLEWASKSDRWLLLGNRTGNIRLFDVREIKTFREVVADQSYPRIVNITANPVGMSFVCSATVQRIRSGSNPSDGSGTVAKPGKLMLWDLRTMKMEKQLPLEPSPVAINCCSYNHNGQLLITGAADGQIRLFDIQQHKCISHWEAHEGEVHSVQFSSDETSCYSMGSDGKFIQWNIHKTGTKIRELAIHQGAALPFLATSPTGNKEVPRGKLFAFDSEGQYILTCDKNRGIIYQLQEEDPGIAKIMDLKGHKSSVTTVDWSPSVDTRVCLMGAMDGKIKISTLLSQ